MKPPIDNVIDRAAITIASRIHGALRLYSPFMRSPFGLSDQATGSCAERHRKSVDKCLRVLKKVRDVLVVVASMLCVTRSSLAADWLIVPGVRVGFQPIRCWLMCALTVLTCVNPTAADAQDTAAKRVLLISTGSRLGPGFVLVDQQILRVLHNKLSPPPAALPEKFNLIRNHAHSVVLV